jgi:hypothetical protein
VYEKIETLKQTINNDELVKKLSERLEEKKLISRLDLNAICSL